LGVGFNSGGGGGGSAVLQKTIACQRAEIHILL